MREPSQLERQLRRSIKRALDVVVSAAVIGFLSPVFAIVALSAYLRARQSQAFLLSRHLEVAVEEMLQTLIMILTGKQTLFS